MNDHWQVQGRQGHGWFGHGTGPSTAENPEHDPAAAFKSVDDRVVAVVHGAIASLPASLRVRAEAQHQRGTLSRLKEALTAWIRGARLGRNAFADRFLGRPVDDPVARTVQSAALAAATANSHADMAGAAGRLADAIRAVGIDQWPRFVADASERARDPATQAAIQASGQPPPHAPDAIRPVYPVETAIAIAAAGLAGGAGAAARALGGAIVKQVHPQSETSAIGKVDRKLSTTPPPGGQPETTGRNQPLRLHDGQQEKHVEGTNNYIPGRSTLTADPRMLLKQFAGRGRQIGSIPVGQAGSKEVFDAGETIGTFRTEAGQSAPTTRGMIHYSNKGAHIVPSAPRGWRP